MQPLAVGQGIEGKPAQAVGRLGWGGLIPDEPRLIRHRAADEPVRALELQHPVEHERGNAIGRGGWNGAWSFQRREEIGRRTVDHLVRQPTGRVGYEEPEGRRAVYPQTLERRDVLLR